jgi:hypothetical protein
MEKQTKTIQSLIGKYVRIKREYIKSSFEGQGMHIECDNGMNGVIYEPVDSIFMVKMDIYGVDLFNHRRDGFNIGSVEPTHQVIVEIVEGGNSIDYPYLWDAKYFEEVVQTTIITKEYQPVKK